MSTYMVCRGQGWCTRLAVPTTSTATSRFGGRACAVRGLLNDDRLIEVPHSRLDYWPRRALLVSLASLAVFVDGSQSVRGEDLTGGTEYVGSTYSIMYPAGYSATAKAGADVLFSNDTRRGVNIGITRLPVRISSVDEYGSLEDVGLKVINAEKQKDGTLRADMIGSHTISFGDLPGYEYEYEVETTRGTKRIVSRVSIKDRELYVVTGTVSCGKVDTCDVGLLDAILPPIRESLSSFRFL